MRVVCVSDTHNRLAHVAVPDGDLLIHAGDLTDSGSAAEVFEEYAVLSKLPHERIVVIPGNHDFAFERVPELRRALESKFPRVTTLIDEETVVNGLRIYGSPWQPWFHDWAYNFSTGDAGKRQAESTWEMIPDDTAILITHGPPHGVLDRTQRGDYVGCPVLKQRIAHLTDLRLHVFGHIHEAYGTMRDRDVLHVNASTCDARYRPVQPPMVLKFEAGRFEVANDLEE